MNKVFMEKNINMKVQGRKRGNDKLRKSKKSRLAKVKRCSRNKKLKGNDEGHCVLG